MNRNSTGRIAGGEIDVAMNCGCRDKAEFQIGRLRCDEDVSYRLGSVVAGGKIGLLGIEEAGRVQSVSFF